MWAGKWVARHGWGLGGLWWLGARRGQRLVPLHAIPRRGAGGGLEAGPRGNCVAVMPCGAWDYEIRKSKGPGVAPCFLFVL